MAETVQFNAERSIPELEQLERVGLFTNPEIRKVQKRRNALEYKIARINKTKESYLKYIQYEIGFLSLIKKRRERIGYMHKKKEIDSIIGKKINNLFRAAIRRYPADTKLWITYRDFLKKMNWHENLSGMLTQMLQVHNKSPELWVTVAKWELEDSNSAETARQLLQRALRFHPESQLIWREYFRMELLYMEQILKRRNVLGVKDTDEINDSVLTGKIPMVVFNQAMTSIKDVDFALSFLPICKEFDFTLEHQQMVFNYLQINHANEEVVWDAMAKQCLEKLKEKSRGKISIIEEEAFIIYEDAVHNISTEKMWNYYLQTILDRIKATTKPSRGRKLVKKMMNLSKRAFETELLSKEMHIERLRILMSCGLVDEAQAVSLQGTERWSDDFLIWRFCLMVHATVGQNGPFYELFQKAVNLIPDDISLPLWNIAIEWATCGSTHRLQDILEMAILRKESISVHFKVIYLKLSAIFLGCESTRELYKRLKMHPFSPELFQQMIDIEKAQFDPNIGLIRKYYKEAVFEFGQTSVDIWMSYIRFELEHPLGKPVNVGNIYSKALKMLRPKESEQFIWNYTLLKNQTVKQD